MSDLLDLIYAYIVAFKVVTSKSLQYMAIL